MPSESGSPPFEIRPSPMQGLGAFAIRRIPAGVRLIEYAGERLTPARGGRALSRRQGRAPPHLPVRDRRRRRDRRGGERQRGAVHQPLVRSELRRRDRRRPHLDRDDPRRRRRARSWRTTTRTCSRSGTRRRRSAAFPATAAPPTAAGRSWRRSAELVSALLQKYRARERPSSRRARVRSPAPC